MLLISEEKLLIEIEHPCPKDFVLELKQAIISALQNREVSKTTDLEELRETNWVLLELLKWIE